jgi:hypothetical protein
VIAVLHRLVTAVGAVDVFVVVAIAVVAVTAVRRVRVSNLNRALGLAHGNCSYYDWGSGGRSCSRRHQMTPPTTSASARIAATIQPQSSLLSVSC